MEIMEYQIERYLRDMGRIISNGSCNIALNRQKNLDLFMEYVIDEERAKEILLDLKLTDFSHVLKNEHKGYEYENLYVFGKEIELLKRYEEGIEVVPLYIKINVIEDMYVAVISFHKQEYPLTYMFKEV